LYAFVILSERSESKDLRLFLLRIFPGCHPSRF